MDDLGLGLGFDGRGRGGYDPAAAAFFARAPAQTSARYALYNTVFVSLRAAGLLPKLDALYLTGINEVTWHLNLIQNAYNLTKVGTVTFTPDVGATGDGATGYYDTGFNPATAVGAKFTQNSASLGFRSNTSGQGDAVDMGNQNSLIQIRSTGNVLNHRVASGTSGSVINIADGAGLFVTSRTGSAAGDNLPYKDGVGLTVNTNPAASVAPSSNNILILSRGGSATYSARQVAAAFIGGGLTPSEVATLTAIIEAYL